MAGRLRPVPAHRPTRRSRPPSGRWARCTTWPPSRSAATPSTTGPTSTPWAACSSNASPARCRSPTPRCRPCSTRTWRPRSPRCPTAASGCPAAMDEVIAWALAKAPDDRPQRAGELAQAAAQALGGGEVRPRGRQRRPRRGRALGPRRPRRTPRASRPSSGGCWSPRISCRCSTTPPPAWAAWPRCPARPASARRRWPASCRRSPSSAGIPAVWGVGASAEAARPYWHWIQLVRAIAARREGPEVFEDLGAVGAWLHAIVPDLELGLAGRADVHIGAEEGRFHLYDALLRLLEIAAERSGLLVVLDDLHFADEASLLALSYISRVGGRQAHPDRRAPTATSSSRSPGATRRRSRSSSGPPWGSCSRACRRRRAAHDREPPRPSPARGAGRAHPPSHRRQPAVRLRAAQPDRGRAGPRRLGGRPRVRCRCRPASATPSPRAWRCCRPRVARCWAWPR